MGSETPLTMSAEFERNIRLDTADRVTIYSEQVKCLLAEIDALRSSRSLARRGK